MNKELEEAIKTCNEIIKENKGTIKILQRTLKSETEEEYLQEQTKAIETVLNYIDNSIPKEVIKEKKRDKELMKQCGLETSDDLIHLNGEIFALQELLEGK